PWNLADVGSQPIGRQRRHAGTVFHFRDGAWRLDGLCHDHLLHHGLRLFRRRDGARSSSPRQAVGVGRLLDGVCRRVDGARSNPYGSRLGPLYVLPSAHRQPLVLYRARARGGVGSWIWCVLMLVAMRAWKRENPGRPVPLAMFGTAANAVLWLWTTVGVAAELLFQVIPAALGLVQTVDAGLARTLFSWTLHAIVYFWLFPPYIVFYTIAPRAAGGRLYSDTMGRLTFVLLLLYSLPVGIHHLLMDPEHGNGWKFIQVLLTGFVTVPTLLTIFTISASMEI